MSIEKLIDYYGKLPKQFEIREPIDREKIAFLIDNYKQVCHTLNFTLAQVKTQQEPLIKLLNRKSDRVIYKKKARYVAIGASFQNTKKEFRTFCTNHKFHDIDAVSSHYSIFKWFASQLNLPITKYSSLKRTLGKTDLYAILNGGDNCGFDDCEDEIKKVVDELRFKYPQFGSDIDPEDNNVNGKFISTMMNAMEMALVDIMMNVFKAYKFTIRGVFYDGFFVDRNASSLSIFQTIFDEFSQHVLSEYGIQYTFALKQHQDIIKETVVPIVVQSTPIIRTDRYVNPKDLEYPCKVVIVQANLGTGKSTAIDSFIAQNGHDYECVVCLTPRTTYAAGVLEMFKRRRPGIILYSDTSSRKISRSDIIIQFESLNRLHMPFYLNKSILLIADECEALCTQITSFETNKNNHYKNISNFEALIKHSTKLIATDAFASYSKKMLHVLQDLDIEYKYFFYQYTYINRPYYQVSDNIRFTECLLAACKLNNNVFLFCSSRSRAVLIRECLVAKIPTLRIAVYMMGEKTTPLRNVNEEWAQYNVVICTSAITIGIDFNIEHFDYLFVYASTKSCNLCRDIMQATYRPRKIRGGLVLCIEENDKSLQNCEYRVDLAYQERKYEDLKCAYDKLIKTSGLIGLTFSNNRWLMNLFIQNAFEHIQDVHRLDERMNALLNYCGYRQADPANEAFFFAFEQVKAQDDRDFLVENGIMDDNCDIEEVKELFGTDDELDEDMEPEFIYSNINVLTKEEYKLKCRLLTKTENDLLELAKYRYSQYCIGNDREMEDNFTFFFKKQRLFFRLRLEKKMQSNEPFLATYVAKTPWEIRHPKYIQADTCASIYRTLGFFTSYENYNIDIDPKRIQNLHDRYKSKTDYTRLTEILEIPVNNNTCLTTRATCITMLNHVLKNYSCGKIITQTKRVQVNKKRTSIITYTYVKDPDKEFDMDLIYIGSANKNSPTKKKAK